MIKNKLSDIWNNCPLCGEKLFFCTNFLFCKKGHYAVHFHKNNIFFEIIDIDDKATMYRNSMFYRDHYSGLTTTIYNTYGNIIYETDNPLSIEQARKLLVFL